MLPSFFIVLGNEVSEFNHSLGMHTAQFCRIDLYGEKGNYNGQKRDTEWEKKDRN